MSKLKIILSGIFLLSAGVYALGIVAQSHHNSSLSGGIQLQPTAAIISDSATSSNSQQAETNYFNTATDSSANIFSDFTTDNSNLTQQFANAISGSFNDSVSQGKDPVDTKNYAGALQNAVDPKAVQDKIFIVTADGSKIKIKNNATDSEIQDYLSKLSDLLDSEGQDINIDPNQLQDDNALEYLSSSIKNEILPHILKLLDALYGFTVPSQFKDFHTREIEHWQRVNQFLSRLGNIQSDPLSALLSISAGHKLQDENILLSKELDASLAKYDTGP